MFDKLMKWLSSDRSEDPQPLPAEISPILIARLRAEVRARFNADLDEPTMREVVRHIQKRQKIEAIKIIREATHLGLKESKDIADELPTLLKNRVP